MFEKASARDIDLLMQRIADKTKLSWKKTSKKVKNH